MILFSRLFVLIAVTLVFCGSLVSCDRYEYPLGKVSAPENAPEYSVTPDINNSPAVVATPAM